MLNNLLYKRTKYLGEFRSENIGQTHLIAGWVQRKRALGSLIFIDLRDRTGILQVVLDQNVDSSLFEIAKELGSEYVISIEGVVRERSSKNADIPTGDVELIASKINILSKSKTPPIHIADSDDASEQNRLKYRYLDLRKPFMQKNIINRHKIVWAIRSHLTSKGFLDIETPFLTKSTPEGARDYLVPSRIHSGEFYALPQSPQLFKQLLMMSGFDKYYQIVKCFRDEDLRADRQPEFTQVDIEMSFVTEEDILNMAEELIRTVFNDVLNVELPSKFERMTYEKAVKDYGSDKPDLRFGMLLKELTETLSNTGFKVFDECVATGGKIKAIVVENGCNLVSKKGIKNLEKTAKKYGAKGLVWIKYEEEISSSVEKFLSVKDFENIKLETGANLNDMVLVVADKQSVVNSALGGLRLEIAKKHNLIDESVYKVLWVTDFPMFEYSEEDGRYYAKHHPFTMPNLEDLDLIGKENHKVRSAAYDMVINGYEVGGGSIRIHDSNVQEKVFSALGITENEIKEKFGFLVDALVYGAPPHGGIAFGLDRLAMLINKTDNIKDVIAFPKNQNAVCPLTMAPSEVAIEQLDELSIVLNNNN
ncbi:MAG: aspartate--tRNA ligase [Clostridiales bacterium]|nr:MAG: aspartate--tRNA ligase [Clostridiales bacterium]